MGNRYIITGVQLALILVALRERDLKNGEKVVDDVFENQCVGNTSEIKKVKIKWWKDTSEMNRKAK